MPMTTSRLRIGTVVPPVIQGVQIRIGLKSRPGPRFPRCSITIICCEANCHHSFSGPYFQILVFGPRTDCHFISFSPRYSWSFIERRSWLRDSSSCAFLCTPRIGGNGGPPSPPPPPPPGSRRSRGSRFLWIVEVLVFWALIPDLLLFLIL